VQKYTHESFVAKLGLIPMQLENASFAAVAITKI